MKKVLFVLMTVILSLFLFAQEGPQEAKLKLEISCRSSKVILGEPLYIYVQITNEGPISAKLVICNGMSWNYEPNCKGALVVKKPDGKTIYSQFMPQISADLQSLSIGQTFKGIANPDGLFFKEIGSYEICAEMEHQGIEVGPTVYGTPPKYFYSWKGHAISNTVKIEVESPTGIDLEAYNYFKGNPLNPENYTKLLQKFPTSTYAGYALLGENGPWNLLPIEELKMRGLDLKTAEKWPETRSQVEREEKERWERTEKRAKQLQAFLDARPDFVYADFLKLELATRLAYIEKYQESERICKELTKKSSDSKESQKAKGLLEYMSEQGWIKSEDDKTTSKEKVN